jgi:antimicrobial peptide system SdpA family protein
MNTLLPEGWAFFTRNPREEQLSIYTINKDKSISFVSMKNMEAKNLFGLNRVSRYTLDKMGTVIGQLPNGYWKTIINSDSLNFHIDSLSIFSVKISRPALCGKYLIEKKPTMPWSYYSSSKNIHLPSKYIIVKFDCNND